MPPISLFGQCGCVEEVGAGLECLAPKECDSSPESKVLLEQKRGLDEHGHTPARFPFQQQGAARSPGSEWGLRCWSPGLVEHAWGSG